VQWMKKFHRCFFMARIDGQPCNVVSIWSPNFLDGLLNWPSNSMHHATIPLPMPACLIGELVDLQGDGANGAVGGLDLGALLALDVAPLDAGRVLGEVELGLVIDAADVEVVGVAPLLAPVRQPLVRRRQPGPRRQQLLQVACHNTKEQLIILLKFFLHALGTWWIGSLLQLLVTNICQRY
jgi:hypothetical protein